MVVKGNDTSSHIHDPPRKEVACGRPDFYPTLKKASQNPDITRKIKEHGLSCACELCDCGQPHRHQGCTKDTSSSAHDNRSFATTNTDNFTSTAGVGRTQAIRPLQKGFDPNPLPMDMQTNHIQDYIKHPDAKQEMIRRRGELDGLIGQGDFCGETTQKQSYQGHENIPARQVRPPTVQHTIGKMESETEYRKYINSDKTGAKKAAMAPDQPANSYGLMYPGKKPLPKQSIKNDDYSGQMVPRRELIPGAECHLSFGRVGDQHHTTTNSEMFPVYKDVSRVAPIKQEQAPQPAPIRSDIVPKSHDDFSFDREKFKEAKAVPYREPQNDKHTSWNMTDEHESTQRGTYPNHGDVTKRESMRQEKIIEASGPFEGISTAHGDFANPGTTRRTRMLKPSDAPKPTDQLESDTSYAVNFTGHASSGTRYLHGPSHANNLNVAPPDEKFQPESTNTADFVKHDTGKVLAAKPHSGSLKLNGGAVPFDSTTSYKTSFKSKPAEEPSRFTEFMKEVAAHGKSSESRGANRGKQPPQPDALL